LQGLLHTLIGTLLVASGTATLNQYLERAYDAQMQRTAQRPLVSGTVSPREALSFGLLLSAAGGLYLALTVNGLAAVLAVSTLLSYLLVYTPLKRKTPLCTLLGAIPGAMPTLIGWAGAANGLSREAWFLFCGALPMAIPALPGDCAHVSRRLQPCWIQDVARFRRRWPLYSRGNHRLYGRLDRRHHVSAGGRGSAPLYLLAMAGAGLFFLYSRRQAGGFRDQKRRGPFGACFGHLPPHCSRGHDGL
jgi:hypothetical protein